MNRKRKSQEALRKEPQTYNVTEKAGMREWLGLAVLALPTLLMAMDISVLYLALPHLAADLGPSSVQMLWIVDIYGFMLAGFLIIMGKLADRVGRRKLLIIGASLFGVTSIFVAYSISPEMLIVTRALLGISGATLMPSTLSLLRNMFQDAKQRSSAIGVWMMCFVVGSVVGPVVGGLMLEWFWWGAVFLLGVPVMLLLIVTAPVLLPEFKDQGKQQLDIISSVLSLAAILAVVFGIKNFAEYGVQINSVIAIAAGVLIGWLFVRRQNRMDDPLLDIRLFQNITFSGAWCILLLGLITLSSLNLYIAQYLQLVQGLSPFYAGLWLIPMAIGVIISSVLGPLIARKVSPAYVISTGLIVAGIGYLILSQIEVNSSLSFLVAGNLIFSFGISPLAVLGTDLIVGAAPKEMAGSASAVSETSAELGAALGIAIMGSVANGVYQSQLAGSIPEGVPSQFKEPILDSLASAVTIAESLPNEFADEILTLSMNAFTNGLNTIAVVSASLVFCLSIITIFLLKSVRPSGEISENEAKEKEEQKTV